METHTLQSVCARIRGEHSRHDGYAVTLEDSGKRQVWTELEIPLMLVPRGQEAKSKVFLVEFSEGDRKGFAIAEIEGYFDEAALRRELVAYSIYWNRIEQRQSAIFVDTADDVLRASFAGEYARDGRLGIIFKSHLSRFYCEIISIVARESIGAAA